MFLGLSFNFFNYIYIYIFFFYIQESYSDLDSFGFLLPATMGFFYLLWAYLFIVSFVGKISNKEIIEFGIMHQLEIIVQVSYTK